MKKGIDVLFDADSESPQMAKGKNETLGIVTSKKLFCRWSRASVWLIGRKGLIEF